MKGMLIKDFCILKLQKNAVLVLLAMCVVFTVFMKSPTYIVNLFPMYGFLLVLGTLTYDEFDRGYSFFYTSCIEAGICERKVCVWLTFLWRNMDHVCSDQSYLCLDYKRDSDR